MTLAHPIASFCKVNVPINAFILIKYFQVHILRKCFLSTPNRFPAKIIVDREIDEEMLSFNDFMEYIPILVTNDSSLFLHLQILSELLKDTYIIFPKGDLLNFIKNNFTLIIENIPQVFVSSYRSKSSQIFIFVTKKANSEEGGEHGIMH